MLTFEPTGSVACLTNGLSTSLIEIIRIWLTGEKEKLLKTDLSPISRMRSTMFKTAQKQLKTVSPDLLYMAQTGNPPHWQHLNW